MFNNIIKYFKKINIYLFLLFILLVVLFINIMSYENFEDEFENFIKNHIFYDENNNLIDHKNIENDEQYQCYKYIYEDDIVIELGGRYGTVSTVINKKIKNKNKHVVIEPDINIINTLKKNLKDNNCVCEVIPYFISNNNNKKIYYDGYSTRVINSEEKDNLQITYNEFKEKYPYNFNVIVADCEGCLYNFLEDMGDDFNKINKIIFEADQPDICNYQSIKDKLINNGFKEIENKDNFRYVYMK